MIVLLALLSFAHAQSFPDFSEPFQEAAPLPVLPGWPELAPGQGAMRIDGEPAALVWQAPSQRLVWKVDGMGTLSWVRAEPKNDGTVAFRRGQQRDRGGVDWAHNVAAIARLEAGQWQLTGADAELNGALAALLAPFPPPSQSAGDGQLARAQDRERWISPLGDLTREHVTDLYTATDMPNRCSCPMGTLSGRQELDRVFGPDGWPVVAKQETDLLYTTLPGGVVRNGSSRQERSAVLWVRVEG